ncbi:hypothetical protein FRC17_000756 [Serendipita sp. 399]|nr:hypothetical protein FRC17_000756 [Serendipita sp. 399]
MSGRPTTANSARPYTATSEYRPQTAWTESEAPSTSHGPASYAYPTQQYVQHGQQHHLYAQEEEDEEEESEEEDVFAYLPPGTAQSEVAPPPHQAHFHAQQQSQQQPQYNNQVLQQHQQHAQQQHQQQPVNKQYVQTPTQPVPAALLAAAGLDPGPTPPYTQTASSRLVGSGANPPAPTSASSRPPDTTSSYERHDFGPNSYSMQPIPFSPAGPGMFPSASEQKSREVRVDLPSTGGSFSSSYHPASPGAKRRISSEPGTSVIDMATTLKYTDDVGGPEEEEEDSPYPEVRASVSNTDDPEMPAMTFRMWFCGIILCMIAIALNTFFNFRYPSPSLSPLVILLISYPMGKFLAMTLPIRTYHLPNFLGGGKFSLNPGPFNVKEHVLIYIMSNISTAPSFSLNIIVVSEMYYQLVYGAGFNLTLILSSQMIGLGLAGLARRFVVWPASMVWPANLVTCTLMNTLHAGEDSDRRTGITRFRFFLYVATGAFFWAFIPSFLFQALSYFSWVCWMAPRNITVNNLFGTVTGLGMGFITFDWAQITWIGSPLMIPWWAQIHVFIGFVFFYWFLLPILYYKNVWNLAYMPMGAQGSFDRFGQVYDVSRIFNRTTMSFNPDAYNEYSALYLPGPFALIYLLAFAMATCLLVHTLLYHGKSLLNGIKKIQVEEDDIHAKLMRNYSEVPDSWYTSVSIFFFIIAVVCVEVWPTGFPVWTLALSILLPLIYMIPCGFIFAVTGQGVAINLLAQIIPAAILPGKPLPNMLFKAFSVQTLGSSLAFMQDLKLGHYMKVPPRATFLVQMVSAFLSAFVQVGVKRWLFASVPDICSRRQPSQLTCPRNEVFFTASAVWGLIGPTRQFGPGTFYHGHLYAMIAGALLPIPIWLWQQYHPKTRLRFISLPVFINGPMFIPPARGINYSSWFVTGFIFRAYLFLEMFKCKTYIEFTEYVLRRRSFRWWSKFNYILSAGLDSGTAISLIIIFLVLQLPFKGTGLVLNWWGNYGAFMNYDANPSPLYVLPEGQAFDVAPNGKM